MTNGSQWPAFSSDAFLDVLRDVYFPRARKAIVECEGIRVRTLLDGKRHAVSGFWQFPFFLESLPVGEGGPSIPVPYIASVVRAITVAGEPGPPGLTAAPYVRWGDFATWNAFLKSRESISSGPPAGVLKKAARLARQVGPLDIRIDDDDPSVFEAILRWKSLQYRRTGIVDRFTVAQNRDFYDEMRRRGLFVVSSLRAGDRLVAGSIGTRAGKRFLFRMPAYDVEMGRHSPGSILNYYLIKSSFDAGDEEFDMLVGDEAYKFAYATHVRWLGSIGREPRSVRIIRVVRARIGRSIHDRRTYLAYKRALGRLTSRR